MTIQRLFVVALLAGLPAAACDKAPPAAEAAPLATRPDKADPKDWCAPHNVPESMCTQCNPELVDRYKAAGDFCTAHGYPESVCPQCHPLEPPEGHGGHGHEEHK